MSINVQKAAPWIAGAVGTAALVGLGAMAVGMRRQRDETFQGPNREMPFSQIGEGFAANSAYDADGDGRINRSTEVIRFSKDAYGSPLYSSRRTAADAADMIVGNRDGFATADEFAALAATYTNRPGATGLTQREYSVFWMDYRGSHGTGGTLDTIQGTSSDW